MKCTKDMFDYSVIRTKRSEIQDLMTKLDAEFAARPVPARGRGRGTRNAVATAKAICDAKKPPPTSLSTPVPEALGTFAPINNAKLIMITKLQTFYNVDRQPMN